MFYELILLGAHALYTRSGSQQASEHAFQNFFTVDKINVGDAKMLVNDKTVMGK